MVKIVSSLVSPPGLTTPWLPRRAGGSGGTPTHPSAGSVFLHPRAWRPPFLGGAAAAVPRREGGEESIASLRGGRGAAGRGSGDQVYPARTRGGLGRRRMGARVWRGCQGRRSLFNRCSGERGREQGTLRPKAADRMEREVM